jgi:glycosyltransferase involved in cell wall biosynthesis
MKKIGVLLPVYKNDREDFLHKAVESIIMQTYSGYRLFIGVDGPVNDSVRDYLKMLDVQLRIRVVWFEENRGLACVLNDLIKVAKEDGCDYYARMDADDISVSNRFDLQLKYLEDHPDVDVVGGAINEIDSNEKSLGKKVVYPLTHEECRKFFRYRDPLAHPAVMFRPSFFEKVPYGYRAEYRKNQDTMLWYDGFLNGCVFANLPDVVLNFRVIDDFYNRRNGWKRAKQMLRDRLKMNKALDYDVSANLFAFAMFCMTISPACVKKILYGIR